MSACRPSHGVREFGEWKSEGDASVSSCLSRSLNSSRTSSFLSNHASSVGVGGIGKLPRKLSALPLDDPVEEMREEIEQSRASLDCNLSALGLTELPPGVPVRTLQKMSLAENNLVSLPEALFAGGSFDNLMELVLSTNQLTSLPVSLFYLPLLETLAVNTNALTSLPFEKDHAAHRDANGRAFLPSIKRIGMESNRLSHLPVAFLEWCPTLEELLLAMNESMLDEPVPYERLLKVTRLPGKRVTLKVDNRPRFVQQMESQSWAATLPWLQVELNKIYPDKVLDYLFLGSLRTAQTLTVYRDLDIGYVLTAGRDLEVKLEPWMQQLILPVDDFPEQTMEPVFEAAFKFIDMARKHRKGVLIHCFAGLSRSVTIAVAYLMHLNGITRDEALAIVRQARPAARPNDGFLRELGLYEEKLRKAHIIGK